MALDSKALVRRWFEEVWNKGRADAIGEMLMPDAAVHGLGVPAKGPEGFKPFHAAFRDAYPDVHVVLDDVIAEGDLVAARWTAKATHRGAGLGFPATGRPVTITGMVFIRVRDGKIVEGWNNFDQLGMLQQLGQIPGA